MTTPTLITTFSETSRTRLQQILSDYNILSQSINTWEETQTLPKNSVGLIILPLEHGFKTPNLTVITEQDLLGEKVFHKRKQKISSDRLLKELTSLNVGELVVHRENGIGRFVGLQTLEIEKRKNDFIKIEYAGNEFLFVPVENMETITRYGIDDPSIRLDKLGSATWKSRRAKIRKRVHLAAQELIKIAVARHLNKAPRLVPQTGEYAEFCARFPYTETEDQANAIRDIEDDLAKDTPMDRLICGDVGFGKTEVALRAAFIAVKNENARRQVAIVVPTTLLCRQHFAEFKERFANTGINVKQLSRLVTSKNADDTRRELEHGSVDIVIGTHALLSQKMKFRNLGLVIIDEEQRFGVKQKEILKDLKNNVHILTLSATPIPRTLQMSMSGVRELSLINTPPIDRLAIHSFVMPYDEVIIREAILREKYRGGRVFFVVPRVKDIPEVESRLQEIVPEVKVQAAHGQMPSANLDKIMNDFYDGKFDVLLATTIVESGLDVPAANTIVIHKANMFGLAQLYQLRGRVGRAKIRAYAYFTLPPKAKLTENAEKRLEAMQKLDSLGAGFSLASYDMDIRGSGNILSDEQSGHIREAGVELYQNMLREAIEKAKKREGIDVDGGGEEEEYSPQVKLAISTLIPENYITDLSLRMSFYRRIADLQTEDEKELMLDEISDRFGKIPGELANLLEIVALKALCKKCGVEKLSANDKSLIITFRDNKFQEPEKLMDMVFSSKGVIKIVDGSKLQFNGNFKSDSARIEGSKIALEGFIKLIGS